MSPSQAQQASGRIALQLLEPPQRRGAVEDFPVSVGLVFPEGELADAPGGRIVDDLGRSVPFEAEVTGWWDPERTRVKWLLLHLRASTQRRYFFEPGGEPTMPTGEPIATRAGEEISIDTGPLQVRLREGQARLFDRAALGGATMALGADAGFRLIGDDGHSPLPGTLADWTLVLEEATPARACVKGTGHYLLPDGSPLARLELRYQFFAGESFVRIYHTLTWMVQNPAFGAREVSLRLSPQLSGAKRVRVGLSDYGDEALDLPLPAGGLYVRQDHAQHFAVTAGDEAVREGEHLGGWVAVEGGDGRGMGMVVREPWQMFPLAFAVDDGGLAVELWPARGERMGFQPNDIMPDDFFFSQDWNRFDWIKDEGHFIHEYSTTPGFMHTAEGAARTHEILVHFYDRSAPRTTWQLNSLTQHPLALRQEPTSAMRVPFLGLDIAPADVEGYPQFEFAIEQIGRMAVGRWPQTHDYGWWRYGMMRWGATGVSYRWFDGHQYNLQVIPWLLYMRGGGRHWLEEGEATARFAMDVGTNHYNTRGAPTGYQSSAAGMPFPWHVNHLGKHAKVHFLAYYYHLTGYRRAREVMEEVIAGAKAEALAAPEGAQAEPQYRRGWARELYNMNQFWVNAWEETLDPEIKALAREWADLSINREYRSDWRTFRTPAVYLYDGLIAQQLLWRDDALAQVMLEHLGAQGYPALKDGGVYRCEDAIAVGWAFERTGDRRYAQVGWDIARTLADLIPEHDWASPEVPVYPYNGHQMYRQLLMPLLVGYSLGRREGMAESDPYVMRDTFVSLLPAGEGVVRGTVFLRPHADGDLPVRVIMIGRYESLCEDVTVTALDADGAELARVTVPQVPRPAEQDRFYPNDYFTGQRGELVLPGARAGAVYALRLDAPETNSPLALVLADADLVHYVPEGSQVEFYNLAGQYHVGARIFTRTRADEVVIDNLRASPYSIRDATTGELLFRSRLGQPASMTHRLGAARMVLITTRGRVDGWRFHGLSPYLAPTREAWFEPTA
ncbi:MAG: hypothetical protein AB7Y46_12235 [Armatimonadota bacterium]